MLLWISWLVEILGVVVDIMVSGDTWCCCGSHAQWRYLVLWISWLVEILGVVVDLMVSGNTWCCCGSHG